MRGCLSFECQLHVFLFLGDLPRNICRDGRLHADCLIHGESLHASVMVPAMCLHNRPHHPLVCRLQKPEAMARIIRVKAGRQRGVWRRDGHLLGRGSLVFPGWGRLVLLLLFLLKLLAGLACGQQGGQEVGQGRHLLFLSHELPPCAVLLEIEQRVSFREDLRRKGEQEKLRPPHLSIGQHTLALVVLATVWVVLCQRDGVHEAHVSGSLADHLLHHVRPLSNVHVVADGLPVRTIRGSRACVCEDHNSVEPNGGSEGLGHNAQQGQVTEVTMGHIQTVEVEHDVG
mmetsp:Transcript_32783/g.45521  ORF Transcript_32783/g.45521 Transcript_32783/m.45521 type:complete len:286 (+) Transcript_32783:793-1650(+)